MLKIQRLSADFETENGMAYAVRDVSLSVDKREVLEIIEESGSGKSQAMFSVMGLLSGNEIAKDGSITTDGREIPPEVFSNREECEQVMDHIRGNDLAMIFQDPMTPLNPVLCIETQLVESILNHMDISKEKARKRAVGLIRKIGIPSPEAKVWQYLHQFSDSMRQRIIITIALACDPKIIIAGKSTTALDMTVQAQALELVSHLKEEIDSSTIIITHDLDVVTSIYDRIAIMYDGKIVEAGTIFEIFEHPQHPYTIGLLSCISNPNKLEKKELHPISGNPPDLLDIQENCPFADRCASAIKMCKLHMPQEIQISATYCCSYQLQHPKACKDDKIQ